MTNFISTTECLIIGSYGNGHCPSKFIGLCCFVEFVQINRTLVELVEDIKSTHGQAHRSSFIELFLLLSNQVLVFELFLKRIISKLSQNQQ